MLAHCGQSEQWPIPVGLSVGEMLGLSDGKLDGLVLGEMLGLALGLVDGLTLGLVDGLALGLALGLSVGASVLSQQLMYVLPSNEGQHCRDEGRPIAMQRG